MRCLRESEKFSEENQDAFENLVVRNCKHIEEKDLAPSVGENGGNWKCSARVYGPWPWWWGKLVLVEVEKGGRVGGENHVDFDGHVWKEVMWQLKESESGLSGWDQLYCGSEWSTSAGRRRETAKAGNAGTRGGIGCPVKLHGCKELETCRISPWCHCRDGEGGEGRPMSM